MNRTAPPRLLLCLLALAGCGDTALYHGPGGSADLGLPPDLMRPPTLDPGVFSKGAASAAEAETHVAAAPNGFVAGAWIGLLAGGRSTNGYRFSKDDGATFEPVQTIDSPGNLVSSDPVLAADAQSNFYLTWIGFRRSGPQPTDMHVYVAKAPAGATQFGDPIEVSEPKSPKDSYDKPWILIANDGSVLVTYAEVSTGGIVSALKPKDMAKFSNTVIVGDGKFRNLVYPCAPPTGSRVYAVYHAMGNIGISSSDDNGATWPGDRRTVANDPTVEGAPAFDDPTCAANGDEVWVSYGLSKDPVGAFAAAKLHTIRIAHSSDGGRTIDRRTDAHDPAAAALFIHPYLVREPWSGALDLVYYAGNKENDPAGSLRRARSVDKGMTFDPSVSVHAPVLFTGTRAGSAWLGDYNGVYPTRGNLYLTYADNTAGTHIGFYRTALP